MPKSASRIDPVFHGLRNAAGRDTHNLTFSILVSLSTESLDRPDVSPELCTLSETLRYHRHYAQLVTLTASLKIAEQ